MIPKKIISILIANLAIVFMLSGCKESSENGSEQVDSKMSEWTMTDNESNGLVTDIGYSTFSDNSSDNTKSIESVQIDNSSVATMDTHNTTSKPATEQTIRPNVTSTKPATTKPVTTATAVTTTTKPATTKPVTTTTAVTTTTKPAITVTQGNNEYSSSDSFTNEVVRLVNIERAKYNLDALTISPQLTNAAQVRAVEIISNFSHTRPDGTNCFTVLKECGVSYQTCGENIAAGQTTPAEVVTAWMNSEGHRANILNSSFKHIGVGYVEGGNYKYNWTQLFTN